MRHAAVYESFLVAASETAVPWGGHARTSRITLTRKDEAAYLQRMTSRQRVLTALDHRQPDRVPIDLGSFHDATLSINTHHDLAAIFGGGFDGYHLYDWTLGMVYPDPQLLAQLHVDTRNVASGLGTYASLEDYYRAIGVREQADGSLVRNDERGVPLYRKPPGSYGFQPAETFPRPLAGEPDRRRIEEHFREPVAGASDEELARLTENARRLRRDTDCVVVGSLITVPVLDLQDLMGMEDFLLNCALHPDMMRFAAERLVESRLPSIERYYRAVGPWIDVAYCVGDDLADQRGPYIDVALYRDLFKPVHKRIVETVRSLTGAKIMFHMCGAAATFLPHLIDIGVDIHNPVQTTAAGMDPVRLKREFGRDLAFWGAIDTQHVLPFGTPEEVRSETRRKIESLGRDGGYVFAPCHNIQVGTPAANIAAMYAAALST
jgi:uroporphyrinogen decarboxylase